MATKTTKTAKTTKAAPKATKTVTTNTGKAKTMPAEKPASKPTTKKKYGTGCIIAFIIGVIAVAALAGIVIYALAQNVSKNDPAMIVEDGDGNKVSTAYSKFINDSFQIKIPTDFKKLNADEVKEQYDVDSAEAVYVSKDEKASFIVATEDDAKVSNDQIESYLSSMKKVFGIAGQVLKTNYYQQGDHNIATMQVVLETSGVKYYEELAFFSVDGQLVLLTFSAEDAERSKWQPVSDYMIKSIEFLK